MTEEPELPEPPLSWSGDRRITILVVLLTMAIAGGLAVAVDFQTKREDLKTDFAEERASFHKELAELRVIKDERDELKEKLDAIEKKERAETDELIARLKKPGADSLLCKFEIAQWTTRIEGAAGMRGGLFKTIVTDPDNPLDHITKEQGRKLLAAVDRWPYPPCAGSSPFGRGK